MHLLKGIRNNLLTKDLKIDFKNTCTKSKKFASWDDICTAYDIDTNSYVKQRQLPKITEKHVNVKFIPKMRVKYASQIFSNTLANNMDVILNLCGGKTVRAYQLTAHKKNNIYINNIICICCFRNCSYA